jgi:hypothetical protein
MEFDNLISKLKGNVREVDETLEIPNDLSGLDDEGDLLTPDPPPARRTAKQPRKQAPKPTKAVQSQVADALTMMITLPAGIMAFRDPFCAGAVLENADNIVAKLVPIVCRNPAMLRWFTEGAGYMDFFALATAIAPVARTLWAHHVSHSVGQEEDEDGAEDFNQYVTPRFSS